MSTSNSVFDQYSKPVLEGNGITFTVLPIVVVGLRFYARRRTRTHIGLDDWFIVIALALCTAAGAVEIYAAEAGLQGKHQILNSHGELVHTRQLTNYEKCRYVNEVITTFNLGVIKISILLFYRRLFIIKAFKIASGVMLGLVGAWAISFTSAMLAQCSAPSDFWNRFETEYPPHCIQVLKVYEGLAASDIIFDVLVLAIPVPMVASLKMPWKTKIKVLDVLLLGIVVIGSGIARVVSFMQVINFANKHPDAFFKDSIYATGGPLFWIFAENAIAIIGACLPTLAPLWSKQHSHGSKGGSYLKSLWKGVRFNWYRNIERPNRNTDPMNDENASNRHLVVCAPATKIRADDIALDDRPGNGIQV